MLSFIPVRISTVYVRDYEINAQTAQKRLASDNNNSLI